MAGTKHNIEHCLVCGLVLTKSGQCPDCGAAKVKKNRTIQDLQSQKHISKKTESKKTEGKKAESKKTESKKKDSKKNQEADLATEFKSVGDVRGKRLTNVAFLFNKTSKERFELSRTVNKVGRDRVNNVSIAGDRHISRYHAWIVENKGKFYVEDLESTNGTLLNGKPVKVRMQLTAGDSLVFGKTEVIFVVE